MAEDRAQLIEAKIEALHPLIERTATAEFALTDLFSACLRSSFIRTYEFVGVAFRAESDYAFFLIPALRGITEDIIYFAFLKEVGEEDRQQVIRNVMFLEVDQRVREQGSFFRTFRPFQPVLSVTLTESDKLKDELQSFWRQNGWPKFRGETPPSREIAQRTVPGIMEQVYDFMFRLTSSAMHFNPELLLKLGWGEKREGEERIFNSRFTTKNMAPYHLAVCQIYGTYLLCLYFELFEEMLDPANEEKAIVAELRKLIWQDLRWPEMVTFEEMNVAVPDPETTKWPNLLVYSLYSTIMNDGFLAGARVILGK